MKPFLDMIHEPVIRYGWEHLCVVLLPYQISNWELVCAFKSNYPGIHIIAQKPLPLSRMN